MDEQSGESEEEEVMGEKMNRSGYHLGAEFCGSKELYVGLKSRWDKSICSRYGDHSVMRPFAKLLFTLIA